MKSLYRHNVMILKNKQLGFTLIEVLVGVFVLGLLVVSIGVFQKNIFFLENLSKSSLEIQQEGRKAIKEMTKEIRSISTSSTGTYPIDTASQNSFTFYSDIDDDGLKERVRYFLEGTTLKKGELKPTGNPVTYDDNNETVVDFVRNIANTNPIFSYYDSSYDGSGAPIAYPIDIASIRLVKVELVIDGNGSSAPVPVTFTFQVTMRNLKDNL